jgi:hypothetical protein
MWVHPAASSLLYGGLPVTAANAKMNTAIKPLYRAPVAVNNNGDIQLRGKTAVLLIRYSTTTYNYFIIKVKNLMVRTLCPY